MNPDIGADARRAARFGGWSLIAAAVGFMAAFAYLAARFNYPDVLDGAAGDVLPRLLALVMREGLCGSDTLSFRCS